jgi:hypothetical protein
MRENSKQFKKYCGWASVALVCNPRDPADRNEEDHSLGK